MPSPQNKNSDHGLLLAGDIGATNTRVALYEVGGDLRQPKRVQNFKGQDYPGLVEILREYLQEVDEPVLAACFGAAGPVVEGQIKLTNLAWTVDAAELCSEFGLRGAWLINDLKAIANSVPILQPSELHSLKDGIPEPRGNIAVIAPGTGLGIGYLTWAAGHYRAYATEGGHSDFAPGNPLQDEMLLYLRPKFPQLAVEHVCSGIGLPNVYGFLKETGRAKEPAWLADELAAVEDVTPVIVDNALAGKPGSELCQMTLEIFVSVLAAEAGNLALLFGATAGVFLAGGMPPRVLPAFKRFNFMQTFLAKSGYEYYLDRFPVQVVLNSEAGLLGAAEFGMQQLLDPEGV